MRDEITSIAIEDYLTGLMPERPEAFATLERNAHEHGWPLVGPVQGQFLYLLAKSSGARDALEIGTATGYAAMWLLKAIAANGGMLEAIERRPDRIALAQSSIASAGFSAHFRVYQGEWFSQLSLLTNTYDLIFLDILRNLTNEVDSLRALDLCVPLIRPGGLLIVDNVLCSGLVLEDDPAPIVRGIQQFNRAIMRHPEFESVILPVRDGVALCRKRDS
ncbi:MAG: O-methyltransferase [Roseiflexaceae bacterium]|nr:O-methyltransferase [Roseiflexaceae bacterium]